MSDFSAYIRPGFAHEQHKKEVEKLTLILQAIRNCHKSLHTISGGEEKTLAQQDLQSAFSNISALLEQKGKASPKALPDARTIDVDVDDEFIDVYT